MSDLIDLDALAPPPKRVQLGGETYLVPGDIPMPLMLRVEQLAGTQLDDTVLTQLYEDVLGLFRVHQPQLEELPITTLQLVQAIGVIYGGVEPDPPKPAAKKAPAKKRPAGTRSTSRRAPARSR